MSSRGRTKGLANGGKVAQRYKGQSPKNYADGGKVVKPADRIKYTPIKRGNPGGSQTPGAKGTYKPKVKP